MSYEKHIGNNRFPYVTPAVEYQIAGQLQTVISFAVPILIDGKSVGVIQKEALSVQDHNTTMKEAMSRNRNFADIVTDAIRKLNQSAESQTAALQQIWDEMDRISNFVQQNAAIAQQSAASAQELSHQVDLIQNVVHRLSVSLLGRNGNKFPVN